MSVSRFGYNLRDELKGRGKRMLRSMLSAVAIVAYEARECVRFRGREAADGSADEDIAEQYGVIGLVSRPPKGRGRSVLAHIGGESSHAVIVASKDDETRIQIVDTVGLDWDELIVHNSLRVIKLTKNGDILIGAPNGQFKAVALADHTHTVPMVVGQASYSANQDPAARTGKPDKVSKDTKVT